VSRDAGRSDPAVCLEHSHPGTESVCIVGLAPQASDVTPVRPSSANKVSGVGVGESGSFAEYLRAQTREAHRGVEAQLERAGCVGQPATLFRFLQAWLDIWLTVGACDRSGDGGPSETRTELLRSADDAIGRLSRDLTELADHQGVSWDPHRGCASVASAEFVKLLGQEASCLGVVYVLWGARLGGRLLANRVEQVGVLPGNCGTGFLTSEGLDVRREWGVIQSRLNDDRNTESERAAAVSAANWTFRWVTTVLADLAWAAPAESWLRGTGCFPDSGD
jgi:heme oxygenase